MDLTGGVKRMMAMAYKAAGTPLAFRSPATGKTVSLSAIDRTSAEVLDEKSLKIGVLKPCCTVMRADLAAQKIEPAAMADMNVTFGGKSWRIMSVHDRPDTAHRVMKYEMKPVPNWETLGEVLFMLMEVA